MVTAVTLEDVRDLPFPSTFICMNENNKWRALESALIRLDENLEIRDLFLKSDELQEFLYKLAKNAVDLLLFDGASLEWDSEGSQYMRFIEEHFGGFDFCDNNTDINNLDKVVVLNQLFESISKYKTVEDTNLMSNVEKGKKVKNTNLFLSP